MEDLWNDKQSLAGAALMMVSVTLAVLNYLGHVETAAMALALAAGMLGALLLLLGMRVTGDGSENVEGLDEVFDLVASLQEIRDTMVEDNEKDSDDES
jgi:hypothetical protein